MFHESIYPQLYDTSIGYSEATVLPESSVIPLLEVKSCSRPCANKLPRDQLLGLLGETRTDLLTMGVDSQDPDTPERRRDAMILLQYAYDFADILANDRGPQYFGCLDMVYLGARFMEQRLRDVGGRDPAEDPLARAQLRGCVDDVLAAFDKAYIARVLAALDGLPPI